VQKREAKSNFPMRIFLDANVLVSVLNREYPHYDACARCLSLADRNGIRLLTSALSLGITFYFSEKKSGRKEARRKMELLLEKMLVSPCGEEEAKAAVLEKRADDFEDALQYFSAKAACSDIILSNNPSDYHFSPIPVKTPENFLMGI
jgi:predicted nucleic acid-binding protein